MPLFRRGRRAESERGLKSLPPLTGQRTAADVLVTPERALQVSAVYSCIRLLAETGSMLPVGTFQRQGKHRVPLDHPATPLLTYQANPGMEAGEMWAQVLGWLLLRGNAAVYVQRDRAGRPAGLWPVAWTSVEPRRNMDTGEMVYQVTLADDEWAPITEPGGLVRAEGLLHFKSFGVGGVEGLSPVGMARQAVGTSFAATSYIGGFFARDATPGGIVSVEGKLSDEQYERLTRQWRDLHEGFDRSHRLAVLEAGAKWANTTLSPADASFLEVYKLSRAEIAGIYGVPPHMIGDVDRSTSWGSGIEQQSLGYVLYSLTPWLTRLERTAARLLGSPDLYVRFNTGGLLRGDLATRYAAYTQGRGGGWLSANDILAKEDEPPIPGGDEYLVPLNMQPAGSPAPPAQRTRPGPPARRAEETEAPALEQLAAWVTRHIDALSEFFAGQSEEVLAGLSVRPDATAEELLDTAAANETLAALLFELAAGLAGEVGTAAAAALGGAYVPEETTAYLATGAASTAANINTTTVTKLGETLAEVRGGTIGIDAAPAEIRASVAAMFEEMTKARARQLAQARVAGVANFASHEGAKHAGARTKTWRVWDTNPRPTHRRADGQTVSIRDDFTVGSRRGRWPHDSRLGVDEIAGCTCRLQFNV
ncbi:phage portal protein [Streptomyces sp. 3MP-14]|uniref:Phage portal protein n=1 Tax=Streptomyces mimosae TaxID=2586635 RepID=A0A5N6AG65_9ACTN|nr:MULTISPECIES: phage portal protein [Streptomyces]KAB8167053.1 phage portal protein [Streptomyces mimosae]KAB8176994.1 phage portal protein [Streptomyces sp. 3MP-14]